MAESRQGTATVLITGGSGFVGRAVTRRLSREPRFAARISSRRPGTATVRGPELAPDADWSAALAGVSAVVHLAARVHVMRDAAADPLAEFRRVNAAGTEALARQAARAGVNRFVYVSSIKVNGEETGPGAPFTEHAPPAPSDPYGVSKHEAELAIARVAEETGMQFVIIRPPLVYGPGVQANFRSMMAWLQRGVPLPLGAIHNRRSLVAVDNLADLIAVVLTHRDAVNEAFLVSDGEDLSTTQLLRRLAHALGRRARLVPVPAAILQAGLAAIGKGAIGRRLAGSLQVDISKARERLGWAPPVSVDAGLRQAAAAFQGVES